MACKFIVRLSISLGLLWSGLVFTLVNALGDSAYIKIKKNQGQQTRLEDGLEFSSLSRSTLLKVLSVFEENINLQLHGKKLKPVFTAVFGNNKFTKPHIYPPFLKKGNYQPYRD